jgi:hypothetical protein
LWKRLHTANSPEEPLQHAAFGGCEWGTFEYKSTRRNGIIEVNICTVEHYNSWLGIALLDEQCGNCMQHMIKDLGSVANSIS